MSERAARKLHAVLKAKRVMLAEAVQLATKVLADTKCVNRWRKSFTNDPRLGQKHAQDRQGEENRQESSRSDVMKYACQHDVAWS